MRVIVDGMGGDNAPEAIVKGAVKAIDEMPHQVVIVGDEKAIKRELSKYKYNKEQIIIKHASEVISGDDPPVKSIRTKKDSSMVVGFELLKNGEGDVFVSCGNTGAVMAGGLFILGRIRGIYRPVLASIYPLAKGGASLLVDAGANSECKPSNYLEFAVMGNIYMENVLGRKNPTVGLLNIGIEENKGNTEVKAARELLLKSDLNFVGNVEARDIPEGIVDIIVCNGFVGNIVLKLTEGLAWSIFSMIRQKFSSGILAKMGALLLIDKLKEIKNDFDYSKYGGAPVLGIRGPVVKMHGSSGSDSVKNAILKSIPFAEKDVVSQIEEVMYKIEEIGLGEEN